jgi:hypothetical protein
MGPRTGMDMVLKRKNSQPRRESNPNHPIVQPLASRYIHLFNDLRVLYVIFKMLLIIILKSTVLYQVI